MKSAMGDVEGELEVILTRIREQLDGLERARDSAVRLSRDLVKLSGKVVTCVISGELAGLVELLRKLEEAKSALASLVSERPALLYGGPIVSALAEYAEARILHDLVVLGKLPSELELSVPPASFLLGLCDVIGELRRLSLEHVRAGRLSEAWSALDLMEIIFSNVSTLDYPEAVVPGLRHKIDLARRLVDDTKTLLVELDSREKLERALRSMKETINRLGPST
ncbi:MAG: hypothetical protein QXU97_01260 [Fervidicoccaceae archaeon]